MVNGMENHAVIASGPQGCEELLAASCNTYLQAERLYAELMDAISDAGQAPVATVAAMVSDLLQDARQLDSAIAEKLGPAAELTPSIRAFLQQREEILRRLHSSNKSLANKAENIQSLIRHEIAGMANNRNAIRGYKPAETERKSIISSSY